MKLDLHTLKLFLPAFIFACLALSPQPANSAPQRNLRVFFIDVEGGQATLFVTPGQKSLLIDTGNAGFAGRDADRIVAAARKAGLNRIDFVLLTHYHSDHAGGVPQLVERFPVGTFIDHGPNREFSNPKTIDAWEQYQKVLNSGRYGHRVAKKGETLPIPGLEVQVVAADGETISSPLPGAGLNNPYCATSGKPPADQTENGRSIGVLINFHNVRILDLGDLTRDRELQLMCPVNRLGTIDVLVVSHHGLDLSSSPALVEPLHSRLAIMDNSAVKGDAPEVFDTVTKAPGMEALWELHYLESGGSKRNTQAGYIANLNPPDKGNYLELIAAPNGSLSMFNPRTLATTVYPPRVQGR